MPVSTERADPEAGVAAATAKVIRDEGDWDRMEAEWNELFNISPTASPPLRFEWLRQWWRIFGPVYGAGADALRILTVRRGGRLIGALPLYLGHLGRSIVSPRKLAFISTGEEEFEETCPDYLDLLHAPGEQEACLSAMAKMLLGEGGTGWDTLDLCDVSEHSPLRSWRGEFESGGGMCERTRGICPIADISGGLERYLPRLSANMRQQSRRLLRQAEKSSARLELAQSGDQIDKAFDDMIRLHQARWTAVGKPGCFSAGRFTEFHRSLARLWTPGGKAVLARLHVNDEAQAVIYGFVVGKKFDFYQSGVAVDERLVKSPGTVAFLMLMQRLSEMGIGQFDFLRGESFYKHRFATHATMLFGLRLVRPGLRMSVHSAADFVRRAWRKSGRVMHLVCARQPVAS